jgi:hypothetical protein
MDPTRPPANDFDSFATCSGAGKLEIDLQSIISTIRKARQRRIDILIYIKPHGTGSCKICDLQTSYSFTKNENGIICHRCGHIFWKHVFQSPTVIWQERYGPVFTGGEKEYHPN